MSSINEWREALEDMCHQFAYHSETKNGPALSTGGLSTLENAFSLLGWDDPHLVPDGKCDALGCQKWATCGTPTPDGYKRLCYDHFKVAGPRDTKA